MESEAIRADLERVTTGKRIPEGETLADALKRLDTFATSGELHERLEHYLSKRSYVKALEWLDHPDTPHHL